MICPKNILLLLLHVALCKILLSHDYQYPTLDFSVVQNDFIRTCKTINIICRIPNYTRWVCIKQLILSQTGPKGLAVMNYISVRLRGF